MPTKVKGTTGVDKIEAGAVITNPSFSGNATVTGTLTVDSTASINGSNLPQQFNFRNLIINGDMRIAQRGNGSAIATSTYAGPDRFGFVYQSAAGYNITQDTNAPEGFANSYKLVPSSTKSPLDANSLIYIRQVIEAQNLQHLKFGTSNAESLTLSFWVKSNKTGTYVFSMRNNDSSKLIGSTYTINSADTWEKKTITFVGDTSGTFNNDNGAGLSLEWAVVAGTDFSSGTLPSAWGSVVNANRFAGQTVNLSDSTSNYFNLTGVQLEVGTNASDFEFLPVDVELARCHRYFCKSYDITTAPATNTANGINIIGGSTQASGYQYMCLVFPQDMRATPSITFYRDNGADNTWEWRRSGASGTIAPVAPYGSTRQMQMYVNAGGSYAVSLVWGHWVASAEL